MEQLIVRQHQLRIGAPCTVQIAANQKHGGPYSRAVLCGIALYGRQVNGYHVFSVRAIMASCASGIRETN